MASWMRILSTRVTHIYRQVIENGSFSDSLQTFDAHIAHDELLLSDAENGSSRHSHSAATNFNAIHVFLASLIKSVVPA